MIKFSTGLRNALLAVNPFRVVFNGAELRIYSGPEPSSADAAIGVTNALLLTIRADGSPLTFEPTAVDGVLQKTLDEVWNGTVASTGTAAFFRLVLPSDTNAASTSAARVQGSVKLIGGDINLTNLSLTAGVVQTLDYFQVSMLES